MTAADALSLPYGAHETWVGDWRVTPVVDGFEREDPARYYALHENAPRPGNAAGDWLPHQDLLGSDGMLESVYGGFLLRRGEQVVLVDAGVGPGRIGPYGRYNKVITGGEMMRQLAGIGVAPAEVTDLVFTHLHPDHIGWAVEDDGQLFPNATARCHVLDWEYFAGRTSYRWGPRLSALEPRPPAV
jgi:glyoxylase-like metal-dependent hydrolase (beta-lactamase superfamily II)